MAREGIDIRIVVLMIFGLLSRVDMYGQDNSANSSDEEYELVARDELQLRVVSDLACELVLQEPLVANPLHVSFDERGRMWVVQYRQYPWPAGLKLLSRDNVWRNVYDPPVPPPPPFDEDSPFRGRDLVSIHEDTDHDGKFDSHQVFVEGLNFATAALVGRGGVFVLNPPRLLFYPDRDRDDRPDHSAPEILLSGFGIEDSHSIANSLRWGPDGWIYATQGSTVSASVVVHGSDGQPRPDQEPVHSLGQNVWRYHPESRRYEVFSEGGGNAFGVEIDRYGRIYSGHNGGDTRGFYYLQGAYSQKNFGKHGQLSNPFAFDYYRPMKHHSSVRFTHTFCIYEGDALPDRYAGRLFGVNPIEHEVIMSEIRADGASRQTRDLATIVQPGDGERANWFTPVDIQIGPDGALYIADWYSVQANHYYNHEGKTNPDLGRIYRLSADDHLPWRSVDLAEVSSDELIDRYLFHPNRWFRQTALRLLGDRRDGTVSDRLWMKTKSEPGPFALDALWALHQVGGLSVDRTIDLLRHPNPHVRRWTLRLLGDQGDTPADLRPHLLAMARNEPDVETRCQLAATAKRLPDELAIPLVFELIRRDVDAADPLVPNMLWWALEAHADRGELIEAQLRRSDSWRSAYRVDGHRLTENLMRRYAGRGRQNDMEMCARLLQLVPLAEQREGLIEAFVGEFAGRSIPPLPESLSVALSRSTGPLALQMRVRQRNPDAIAQALSLLRQDESADEQQVGLIRALGDVRAFDPDDRAVLFAQLGRDNPDVQTAALLALQKLDDPGVPQRVLQRYDSMSETTREVARQVLSSRRGWAEAFLQAVDKGQIAAADVDAAAVQRLRRHRSATIESLLDRWFPLKATDDQTLDEQIESLESLIRTGNGDPLRGREIFRGRAECLKCHRLFAEGGDIGPDLTSYNRSSLRRMLLAVVHPSAEIREGFESYTAITSDGRILSGLKIEHNDHLLVLRGTDGHDQTIATDDIDQIETNLRSLMPDGLLNELSDEEIRDLFAYLTSTTPPL